MLPNHQTWREPGWVRRVPATNTAASAKFENSPKPAERYRSRVISASTFWSMPDVSMAVGEEGTLLAMGGWTWACSKTPAAQEPRASKKNAKTQDTSGFF